MSLLAQIKVEVTELLKDAGAKQRVDVERVLSIVDKVKQLKEQELTQIGNDVAPMLSRVLPMLERLKGLGLPVVLPQSVITLLRERIEKLNLQRPAP